MRGELYNIMSISNIPSIMEKGILSHNLMKKSKLDDHSIAMQEVQDKRKGKVVPSGRFLHDYANLFFDAHNPMLSSRRDRNHEICVLRVSVDVLHLTDVIITDQNAASDYVQFLPSPQGLEKLDFELIYAENWKHPDDQIAEWRHSSVKGAEVLVPDRVDPKYIIGAYVYNQQAKKKLEDIGFCGTIEINNGLFF